MADTILFILFVILLYNLSSWMTDIKEYLKGINSELEKLNRKERWK
jgi:hypothetical protein